jgi:hypothetical protein
MTLNFTLVDANSSAIANDQSKSVINCTSHSHCTVQCDGNGSCKETVIECPEDSICSVECHGPLSCYGVTITGAKGSKVALDCIGVESCRNAVIIADDADELLMTGCAEPGSCIGVTMFCPSNLNGVPKCSIYQDGAFGGTEDEPMNVYAVHGFEDLNVIIYGNDSNTTFDYQHGTMHCTDDYSSSCSIDTAIWECDGVGHSGFVCDIGDLIETHPPMTTQNASPVTKPWESASFPIVMVIVIILMLTICFMKYLMNRKPYRPQKVQRASNVIRASNVTESLDTPQSVDDRCLGITLHGPRDSNSQHDFDVSCTITATPSERPVSPSTSAAIWAVNSQSDVELVTS